MSELLLSPGWVGPYDCKSEKGERKLPGEKLPALTPVSDGAEFEKIWPACQGKMRGSLGPPKNLYGLFSTICFRESSERDDPAK
jgi:hypothetical protein